jgi:hypothetical protein
MKFQKISLLTLVAILSGAAGCSLLKDQTPPRLGAEVLPASAAAPTPPEKYAIELRPEKGQPQSIDRELTAPIHVQQALEQAGLAKRWPRMGVEMYRHLPTGGWHKMSLEFDYKAHRVPPEFDYSVQPGDRIIVSEVAENLLDDLMQAALSPLGIVSPEKKRKRELAHKYQIRG